MAKKNTPESQKPPGPDAGDAGKKRRGFISDFDMWDMNLDISSDDTIDPMVRTGEFPKQTGAKPSAPVESRAKTVAMAQRKPQQPVAKRNASDKGSAIANRTHSKPSSHAAGVTAKPQSKPGHTRPASQHSARQSMSRTQPVTPVKKTPQGQNVKGSSTQARTRPAGATSQSQRREAAVFTTRDVDRRIIPQDVNRVEELKKKRQREKIVKSVSWFWFVIESIWKLMVKLSKLLVRMMPVLYRHKAVVGAAVVSFALGIYFGTSGDKADVASTVEKEVIADQTAHVSTHSTKKTTKHQRKQKHVAQKREPMVSPQQPVRTATADQNVLAQDGSGQNSVAQGSGSSEQKLADNQFSGKDIPLEGDVVSEPQATSATNQPNAPAMTASSSDTTQASVQQTQTMAKSPKLDDDAFDHLLKLNVDFFNQKKWQQVVDTSNQILALKPFAAAALINRSAAYTEMGQFALAVEDANTLISMNKNNGVAYNNRAYAYEKAGNIKYAVTDYTKACTLGIQQSCNDMQRLAKLLSGSQ